MKHPALARVFAVVLAIVSLILLTVGIRGLQKNETERADRAVFAGKLADRIENYRELHARLLEQPDYERTMKTLDYIVRAHERAASRHKTDTAIYTATKGGLKMGENLILDGKEELARTRALLRDPETRNETLESALKQLIASGQFSLPWLSELCARASAGADMCRREREMIAYAADRLRYLMELEPQPWEPPPEEPEEEPAEEDPPAEEPPAEEPPAEEPPADEPPAEEPPAEEPPAEEPPEEADEYADVALPDPPVEPEPPEEPAFPAMEDAVEEEREAAYAEIQAAYDAACDEYQQSLAQYEQDMNDYLSAVAEAEAAAREELWSKAAAREETWSEAAAEEPVYNESAEQEYLAAHAAWEEECRSCRSLPLLEGGGETVRSLCAELRAMEERIAQESPKMWEAVAAGLPAIPDPDALASAVGDMSNEDYLALADALQEILEELENLFLALVAQIDDPIHLIILALDELHLMEPLMGYVELMLDKAEGQLQGALEQLWYQAGELKKDQLKLEAEKRSLDREAKAVNTRAQSADALKELRSRHSAARLSLLNIPEVKAAVTDDESIPAAAESYLETYRSDTERLYGGKRIANALAVAGGVMGALGVPAAYELVKKRFWLLAPVSLCMLCAAAAEALYEKLGQGRMYTALITAILALLQLLTVLPRKRRRG